MVIELGVLFLSLLIWTAWGLPIVKLLRPSMPAAAFFAPALGLALLAVLVIGLQVIAAPGAVAKGAQSAPSQDSLQFGTPYHLGTGGPHLVTSGLSFAENWGRWSNGPKASITLDVDQKVLLQNPSGFINLAVRPAIGPSVSAQRVEVHWGNGRVAGFEIAQPEWISLPYDKADWSKDPSSKLTITLAFPNAFRPVAVGQSSDARDLALGFEQVSLTAKPLGTVSSKPLSAASAGATPWWAALHPLSGFLPVEGPYPQWELPKVMWGMHDAASAQFPAAKVGAVVLTMRARSPYAAQSIDVNLGDQHVGICALPQSNVFVVCAFRANVAQSAPVVKLRFSKSGSLDGGRTVLFTDLTLKAGK